MSVYLDCNATAPLDPRVQDLVVRFLVDEYGNAGSRTHEFGVRAKQAVQKARDQVGALVHAERDEVIFTSGATESNNIAILGLAPHAEAIGRRHIVTTAMEHKAVLEPLASLEALGFHTTAVMPQQDGMIDPVAIVAALRPETVLVSVMHVNNETGVIQPIQELCKLLADHPAYLHVDAAQGFGKDLGPLQSQRIDLISISGHKIYAPKGVGALITRRRGYNRAPLTPLQYGGGQERGLRPGTLPVPLIVGLGMAAELAAKEVDERAAMCRAFRERALRALAPLEPAFNGDPAQTLPHTVNVSFAGLDSEAVMLAWKPFAAVSNGSACTSHSYEPSHVLRAMGLTEKRIKGAIRLSWSHMTQEPDWDEMVRALRLLL